MVKLKIYPNYTIISGDVDYEIVDEATRFRAAGYRHSMAYKRHVWDGYTRLFNQKKSAFPTGLLMRVKRALVKWDKDVVFQEEDLRTFKNNIKDITKVKLNGVTLRKHQIASANAMLRKKHGVLWSATNCHAPGQEILMFDGSLKLVEDILIGDKLMGPDSTPRTVQEVHSGICEMVRVVPSKGDPFEVTLDHMLTLESITSNDRIDISVRDWFLLPKWKKDIYKLVRTGVSFDEKELPIDPYLLGILIGDGCLRGDSVRITNSDPEIRTELVKFAKLYDMGLTITERVDKTITYNFTRKDTSRGTNLLKRKLSDLRLYGCLAKDKFLPDIYKINSEENRLQLLAGLLDTDGRLSTGWRGSARYYEYTSASEQLAKDITFLTKSLGFAATIRPKISNNYPNLKYYQITLYGDVWRIPVKVSRKSIHIKKRKHNQLRTKFSVEHIGMGNYHGFSLDKDKRYLLGDFTINHNSGKTEVAIAVIKAIDLPTLFIVKGKDLVLQTYERFKLRLGPKEVGVVSSSKWDVRKFTVASADTLSRRLLPTKKTAKTKERQKQVEDLLHSIDVVVVDECFPAGTKIGNKEIQNIKIGDTVRSFDEVTQSIVTRRVVRLYKSIPNSLVKINTHSGVLVCTPNHPIYTQRGWVVAANLTRDDCIVQPILVSNQKGEIDNANGFLQKRRAMGSLQSMQRKISSMWAQTLSKIILRLVWHIYDFATEGTSLLQKAWHSILQQSLWTKSNVEKKFHPYETEQPCKTKRCSRKNKSYIQTYGLQADHTGWKRSSSTYTPETTIQSIGLADRSKSFNLQKAWKSPKTSLCLQSRYWKHNYENSHRGRWWFSRNSEGTSERQKENFILTNVRVDSVTILKSGSDGRFGGLCPDGYVYNFEVEGTHTYLANGFIVHNCHGAASRGIWNVVRSCSASYRFGLSGTPFKRGDKQDLKLIALTGDIIYRVTNKEMIEDGISTPTEVVMIDIPEPKIQGRKEYRLVYGEGIVHNEFRNIAICELTDKYHQHGKQVVIMIKEIEHGKLLDNMLHNYKEGAYLPHEFIYGDTPIEQRTEILDAFKQGMVGILITSVILDQGIDIPNIDVLILAGGGASQIKSLQRIGRGLRWNDGKEKLTVIDFVDTTHRYLAKHSLDRVNSYVGEDCFDIDYINAKDAVAA